MIFDFNGTLFDDSAKQEDAWREFIHQEFHHPVTTAELKEFMHGRNNEFILQHFAGQPLDKETMAVLAEKKEHVYRQMCRQDPATLHLRPSAVQLLNDLKARHIPRTIATASQKSNLDFFVDSFQLAQWFDVDHIVYNNGHIKGKPAPDFYVQGAHQIGLRPAQCVVFEDSISGLEAAANAHIGRVVAIVDDAAQQYNYARLDIVDQVVTNFDEFDRNLLQ